MNINEVAEDEDLIEVGRKAVEDLLVQFREDRTSIMGCGNGFVIREKDGAISARMRLSTRDGIRVALRAIAKHTGGIR